MSKISEMIGSIGLRSVAAIRIGMTIPEVKGIYEKILINNVSGLAIPEIIT